MTLNIIQSLQDSFPPVHEARPQFVFRHCTIEKKKKVCLPWPITQNSYSQKFAKLTNTYSNPQKLSGTEE